MDDAIMGTFVSIKTMADGTPRLVLDLQCDLTQVAAMGLQPGAPFGVARLMREAAGKPVAPKSEESKEKPGQLCVMAVTFCADPLFQKWCKAEDESDAKEWILTACGIRSRKELDADREAAHIFMEKIRGPFMAYKASLNRPRAV